MSVLNTPNTKEKHYLKKKPFNLTKRPGSRFYYVQFYDTEGHRYKISTGQVDKESARRMCERNMARLGLPMPLTSRKDFFKDFAKDFYDYETSPYLRKHRNSEEGIGHDWADTCQKRLDKYLIKYWGEYELNKITPYKINEWLESLYLPEEGDKKPLNANTVKQIFDNFKTILDEAVRKGKLVKNPCRDDIVEKPKKKKGKRRNILSPDAFERLFDPENLPEVWGKNKMPHYVANLLLAMTGMRLGEIMALRDEDIKGTDREPFLVIEHSYSKKYGLKDTKTKEKRIVPIHPYILHLLEEIKPAEGYVFSLDGGKTPIKEGIRRALYRALERIGISQAERKASNVVLHSWRYFCDTILLESGMPIAGVQAITGHKTEEMTEHYSRVDGRNFGRRVQAIQEGVLGIGA